MASLTAADIRKRFDDADDPDTVEAPTVPHPGAVIRDLFPTTTEPASTTPPPAKLADVLSTRAAQYADSPSPAQIDADVPDVARRNLLDVPEGFETSSIVPFMPAIRKTQTPGNMANDIRFDIGGLRPLYYGIRDLLQGPEAMVFKPATEENPTTSVDLSDEAKSALALIAGRGPRDLKFGPREFVPPGLLDAKPVLSPEFKAQPTAPGGLANLLDQEAVQSGVVGPTSATGIEPPKVAPYAATPATPQPVGAQWSGGSQIVGITPAEEAAYRVNAEGRKLIEPQPIGVPDRNAYVEGVNPNLAEQEQQVHTARELKALNIRSTDASQEAKEIAGTHNEARTTHLNNVTGAETDILRRTTQRQADITRQKAEVFGKGGPDVDVLPIVENMRKVLAEPENRQNSPLIADYAPIVDRLINKDGTPKILDPRELWGLRMDIERLTDKRMSAENSNLHYIGHQLHDIAGWIDQQIEPVRPGYREMMDTYKGHSQEIAAMRVLQDEAKKTYVSGGGTMRMTFEGVQRMMKHITDMRNADPSDINPYKNISEDRMAKLWALRDDLRRSASAVELAKTPGSDTAQNVWDMVKGLASGPEAQHALHAWAASTFGVPGYVASRTLGAVVGGLRSGAQAARDTTRAQELLRPTNKLIDPNASP